MAYGWELGRPFHGRVCDEIITYLSGRSIRGEAHKYYDRICVEITVFRHEAALTRDTVTVTSRVKATLTIAAALTHLQTNGTRPDKGKGESTRRE